MNKFKILINKFIQNTKLFFNKKPVRIVAALLVIAAILTGVAFGMLALIGVFKEPCKSGYHYDNNLKVCVKDGCKNVCGIDRGPFKKGNCFPDDYCNYSGLEGNYYYDEDSCGCKLDCSEGEGYTKLGKKSTLMREDNNKPENPLTCGYYCEYASYIEGNDFGGNNWCMNGYTCGLNKLDTKPPTYGKFSGMCLDSSYELCSGSESIACLNGQCVSTPEGPLCPFVKCGDKSLSADDKIKRIACEKLEDCYVDGNKPNNPTYKCQPLSKREFQTVGICVDKNYPNKSGTNKPSGDHACLNPTYIGENKDGKVVDCSKATKGKDKSGRIVPKPLPGVTRRVKQCSDSLKQGNPIYSDTTDLNTCAIYGVCSSGNEWEAYPNDNKTQFDCTPDTPKICSLGEQCEADETDCCPGYKAINPTDSSKSFCCGVSITDKNPNCFNQTLYAYSKSKLNQTSSKYYVSDPITAPAGTTSSTREADLKKYNTELKSQLKNKSSSVLTDNNYAGFYWDEQKDGSFQLKANCGVYNNDEQQNDFDIINIEPTSSNPGVSYCVPKSKCTVTLPKYLPPPGSNTAVFNGIPICYKPKQSKGPYYWTADPTKPKQTDYITTASASFTNCNQGDKGCIQDCTTENSLDTCISIGKKLQGFNDVTYDNSNNECIFNIACANTSHDLGLSKPVPWTDIGSKLQSSGPEIIKTSAGEIFKNSISQTPGQITSAHMTGYSFVNGKCQGSLNGYPIELTKSPYDTTPPNYKCEELTSDFNINLLPSGVYCSKGVNQDQQDAGIACNKS